VVARSFWLDIGLWLWRNWTRIQCLAVHEARRSLSPTSTVQINQTATSQPRPNESVHLHDAISLTSYETAKPSTPTAMETEKRAPSSSSAAKLVRVAETPPPLYSAPAAAPSIPSDAPYAASDGRMAPLRRPPLSSSGGLLRYKEHPGAASHEAEPSSDSKD
jgi:hypothetical protein